LKVKLSDKQKKRIVESLKPIRPEKIVLFGSYAWGEPGMDSDIDLYIVTSDDFMPMNFSEKMEVKMIVARRLMEFRKKNSTDLLVHTKPMHRKFLEMDSSFARKLMAEGIDLL
jgi:predicted nucleotidyltransferase